MDDHVIDMPVDNATGTADVTEDVVIEGLSIRPHDLTTTAQEDLTISAEESSSGSQAASVSQESTIGLMNDPARKSEEEIQIDASSTRYRSYFEVDKETTLVEDEQTLCPVQGARDPIVLTSTIKYLKWSVPVPTSRARKNHHDVVLGISTKNLNLNAIEAIVMTTDEEVRGLDTFRSEVITHQELRRLCSTKPEQRTDSNSGTVDGEGIQFVENTQISKSTWTTSGASCFFMKASRELPAAYLWSVDLLLSCDGSQFAVIDLVSLEKPDYAGPNYNSNTAFYRCDVNHTDPPEGAVAGSGFVRYQVEQKCPKLTGYSGKAQFHIVNTQSQDVTDELFVTCDGATIEVYGVYPNWQHLRSIFLNQAPKGFDFDASVKQDLLHLLRGRFLVLKDPDATYVSTWDIEQGSRISSFTQLTTNQISAVNKISTMSTDGRLIAIPGQRHVDVFLTATWTLVGIYVFQDFGPTDRIGNVRFIRNDTHIIVSTASEGFRFYRNNRGFVLNIETMSVVERYISEGSSSFWLTTDHPTNPEVFYVRDPQISLLNLEDRIVQSPFKMRERCDYSCFSLASPEAQGTTETISSSGLVFKKGFSTSSVVTNGRREFLSSITITISEKNGSPPRTMSIPLPKAMELNRSTIVSNSSHMVVAFNNMVMVWSIPTFPQGELRLQLVHTGDSDVIWKLCPHGQLYGIRTGHNNTIVEVYLDDPLRNSQSQFLGGIRYLVEVFESAGDVMKQDIIQYVGKYINCYLLDDHFGGDVMVPNNPWNSIMLDNNPSDNIRPDDTLSGNIRLDTLSDNI
ncbi:hypothetical protein BGX23_005029, partial [Mortierella sp. AD031]